MSLQSRIKKVARELAMEEMHKRGGRIGLAYHGVGSALSDDYGLETVGGRTSRRRSVSRARAGIVAMGMRKRSMSRRRSMSRGRAGIIAEGIRRRSRSRSMGRASGEAMKKHRSRSRSMSRGGMTMKHRSQSRSRSMSRGRALDDTYNLPVQGGIIAYGMRKKKSTRKPSEYNMFVKKHLLKNPSHTIREAASAWRARK
jgi:hypothetical protein